MKNILIIGHGRHGKDTVAEMLQDEFGFTFESSSMAAARIFLYDLLKDKYGYKNFEACYEDRANHRAEWYEAICEYNREDKARLAKEILKESNIYVGMRDNAECDECLAQGVFDIVIGVFDPRKPLEPASSFNINMWEKSDIIISNAEGLHELREKVRKLEGALTIDDDAVWYTSKDYIDQLEEFRNLHKHLRKAKNIVKVLLAEAEDTLNL